MYVYAIYLSMYIYIYIYGDCIPKLYICDILRICMVYLYDIILYEYELIPITYYKCIIFVVRNFTIF